MTGLTATTPTAKATTAQVAPVQTTIGTITLNVKRIATLTNFYESLIGLTVLEREMDRVVLGMADRALLILCRRPEAVHTLGRPGLYHLALRVPSPADLAHWFGHYVELGAPLWQGASDHGVSQALYLSDPEGNGIEITCDAPRHEWDVRPNGQINVFARRLDMDELLGQRPSEPWTRLPNATDIGHIHLRVADIPIARAFYVDLLGLVLKTELPGSALFVADGDYHHHIGLNVWQSRGAPPAPAHSLGLASFDLAFSRPERREEALSRLAQSGHPVQAIDCGDGNIDFTVTDPFGICMVLKGGPNS